MKLLRNGLIFILTAILCLCALVACDSFSKTEAPTEAPTQAPTEAPTQTPTEAPTKAPEDSNLPDVDAITIAEAIEICMANDEATVERYYIIGTVDEISNPQYGEMTVSDETGSIYVYGTFSADGEKKFSELDNVPHKGDIVVLHCTLQNYSGTPEVKNARLIYFEEVKVEVDESQYTSATIAEARNAPAGTLLKISGVVAQITYANGQVPSGVYLVDGTQSIYIHSSDVAGRAKIGNTVTLIGKKAYWVLDSEKDNAEKFGYAGCCQLEEASVVEIDSSIKDFDTSWIDESTVKEILETPVTENITTEIFKVNALVKKVEGTGFINYYFFDLDGETGAYTYTQCNGKDFSWLDEFDGKICTVYLAAHNAKSTATSCNFRFTPIKVVYENFKFDLSSTAEHVVKYYGLGQFNADYTGNPKQELLMSVSSELLGFEGALLEYSTSDEDVVYFTVEDGKVYFNCGADGTARVTIKGIYGGKTYTDFVDITVGANDAVSGITVQEAIDSPEDSEIVVKGIVGPSVVNKNGFYLIDETGVITVVVKDVAVFDEIEIGHEIVIKGKRESYKKDTTAVAGQISIVEAEVVANYYGQHEYDTSTFITGKTLADIYSLDAKEDHSAEVYIVKATVNVVEQKYYTNIELVDGSTKLTLYCSSAGQYSFLKAFAGQEVELEVAPCNWNDKNYYRGCVLAVYTEDGKVLNELNFNN